LLFYPIADVQEKPIARQAWKLMLTKKQIAERFQVDVRTITIWMNRAFLPYYRATHSVGFKWSDLQRYWDARSRVSRGRPGF